MSGATTTQTDVPAALAEARDAASPVDTFRLPLERTATVGALIGF